jgi:cytochrome c5
MLKMLIISTTVLFTGCYYDHAEQIYPSGTCDVSNVSYTATISEIIIRNGCLSCHSGTLPSGGFVLNSYAAVKAKASDGRLWGSINQLPGYVAMPQGGTKMSQCDINKIKAWIDSNMP